jgi:hypothetical protein
MPEAMLNAAKQFGSRAAAVAGEQVGRIAEQTERSVRKYPLAAIGIAFASGAVLGTLGAILFKPREPTLAEKLKDMELYSQARRLWSKYF